MSLLNRVLQQFPAAADALFLSRRSGGGAVPAEAAGRGAEGPGRALAPAGHGEQRRPRTGGRGQHPGGHGQAVPGPVRADGPRAAGTRRRAAPARQEEPGGVPGAAGLTGRDGTGHGARTGHHEGRAELPARGRRLWLGAGRALWQ